MEKKNQPHTIAQICQARGTALSSSSLSPILPKALSSSHPKAVSPLMQTDEQTIQETHKSTDKVT